MKTVLAVFITVLLMSNPVLAVDFGALPKYGPVPEMRPLQVTQAKLESLSGLIVAASCDSACIKIMQSAD